jgi:hypothetical protein
MARRVSKENKGRLVPAGLLGKLDLLERLAPLELRDHKVQPVQQVQLVLKVLKDRLV